VLVYLAAAAEALNHTISDRIGDSIQIER